MSHGILPDTTAAGHVAKVSGLRVGSLALSGTAQPPAPLALRLLTVPRGPGFCPVFTAGTAAPDRYGIAIVICSLLMTKFLSPEELDAMLRERAHISVTYERAKVSLLTLASIAAATQETVEQSRALMAKADAILARR